MPRGSNPNSRANLKPVNQRTKKEQREIAVMGGKASGVARANYASLRECFKTRMTAETMDMMYDKLLMMFLKGNNLNAYDRLVAGTDDESDHKDASVTIKFASEDMDQYGD